MANPLKTLKAFTRNLETHSLKAIEFGDPVAPDKRL